MPNLVTSWLAVFGDAPIHPRDVIDIVFDPATDPALRSALTAIIPNPSPRGLNGWLSIVEDQPFKNGTAHYRFSRLGHKWRLLPARDTG